MVFAHFAPASGSSGTLLSRLTELVKPCDLRKLPVIDAEGSEQPAFIELNGVNCVSERKTVPPFNEQERQAAKLPLSRLQMCAEVTCPGELCLLRSAVTVF